MRKFFTVPGRTSAVTAKLASLFIRRSCCDVSADAARKQADIWNSATTPETNREFADAAIRASRTLF